MDNVLFKARLDHHQDGEWDYFCQEGVGYRDYPNRQFNWKVENGVVLFTSSGDLTSDRWWEVDSEAVQLAYQQYIAKLVTE